MVNIKPKRRSRLRIVFGRLFYTFSRYCEWYLGGKRYAIKFCCKALEHRSFEHKTPLLRQLKNVDMWMQHNKIINLGIAIKKIDKVILRPGETFSYWRLIGRPMEKKGYKEGMVLFYGGFAAGIGGGLCQLSNLIYWMTLHTPLTVTERYRHSFDVFPDSNRTQPFGSGATCVYNYRDLQIYNDTDDTYQLCLYMDQDYLYGEWRSTSKPMSKYEVYEKEHRITHEVWGGYVRHNTLHRREIGADGNVLTDEYLTENHAIMMYQPFLSEGTYDT